jgi:biopolymer transport protein TolR
MADPTTPNLDPPLSPAQRSRVRRLSQPKEHDPTEAGGELNIIPFLDIITNVLMFVLATLPAFFTVTIETNPPSIGSGRTRAPDKPTLNLTMLIVNDGVSFKASGGNIATGCEGPGPGVTVPRRNGEYDWAGLKACAKKLKAASPDFAEETTVQILAEPGTEYQTVISSMDAVREADTGDPNKPEILFPDVNFGVAKLALSRKTPR